jgi:hypothetical protein
VLRARVMARSSFCCFSSEEKVGAIVDAILSHCVFSNCCKDS